MKVYVTVTEPWRSRFPDGGPDDTIREAVCVLNASSYEEAVKIAAYSLALPIPRHKVAPKTWSDGHSFRRHWRAQWIATGTPITGEPTE